MVLGIAIPKGIDRLSHANYNRASLDHIMHELLGQYSFNQALTDELLVVAYDYNSQEPRFFSKYFANMYESIYGVSIGNATAASSAAPTFFDPRVQVDRYGLVTELQIDGGVICNNPGLYAYYMARNLRGHKKIRLLSLGTGEIPFVKKDPEDMNKLSYIRMMGEFMMNTDTYTADNWLNHTMPDAANNYVRI